MESVLTFVFFDTETTGLPWQQNNATNIVELAMVAVSRDNILNRSGSYQPEDVLTMRFKPNIPMDPIAEQKTGITNESLCNEKPFDNDTVAEINNFLNKLPAPVCLIAHNGYAFDYPIFNTHLTASKIKLKAGVLCIDSLPMFRQFHDDANGTENYSPNRGATYNTYRRFNNWRGYGNYKKKNTVLFNLKDIYTRFFNSPPEDAHRAEKDCLILLKCCLERATEFVHWCETKSILIKAVPHMQPGKLINFRPRKTQYRENRKPSKKQ